MYMMTTKLENIKNKKIKITWNHHRKQKKVAKKELEKTFISPDLLNKLLYMALARRRLRRSARSSCSDSAD